jgi:CheY-like chemotaxis protein
MVACDGFELATVIRQQEEFVGISIVFLSAESNIGRQLFALRLGGDDFLIKPIEPDHLVSVVTSRVERSRVLRSFMVRDSLTGLLNHTAIKEQLEIQLARTRRLNGKLSFAMLDIDHFKTVNDTYGHSVGDRVLKSLSRLLQQRLRETDIVGRAGGGKGAGSNPRRPKLHPAFGRRQGILHHLQRRRGGFSAFPRCGYAQRSCGQGDVRGQARRPQSAGAGAGISEISLQCVIDAHKICASE